MPESTPLRLRLSRALFLSTMLNINTARFCAEHGQGARMVQLGTMLVAPETAEYAPYRKRWPDAFLPRGQGRLRDMLSADLGTVRAALGDAVVCLSIGGFDISHVVDATAAFRDVGGELVELNAHGGIEPWASQGYFAGMSRPEFRSRLVGWTEALAAVGIPLIVKFNSRLDVDFAQACDDLSHISLFGIHFNVRDDAAKKPNLAFVRAIRPHVKGALLCSGYAWTAEDVHALLDAGADMVGLAQPTAKDTRFIGGLANEVA